jgi:hypothetical protein
MFSRAAAVSDADGRTREAKIIKQTVADLVEHVGGRPSAAERLLIDVSAVLVLRLRCALDRHATGEGEFKRLFAEKPLVRLHYPGGLSPADLLALPLVLRQLQEEHPRARFASARCRKAPVVWR